jgi:murein DD-endopeptidase MepM/ murein hydrolase activator NlpD
MNRFLIGTHEPGLNHLLPDGSPIVHLATIGQGITGRNYDKRFTNIIRIDYGFDGLGTVPPTHLYDKFATDVVAFLEQSENIDYVVLGNELAMPWDWPNGVPINIAEYNQLYRDIVDRVRAKNIMVPFTPAAIAPWNDTLGDWVDLFRTQLSELGPQYVGWLGIHVYSHGIGVDKIYSDAKMNPPYNDRYYNFKVYRDWMGAVPNDLQHLPVYITEADANVEDNYWPKDTRSTDWVVAAAGEINHWNNTDGTQKILGMCLYRLGSDNWNFSDNHYVHQGIADANDKHLTIPELKWQRSVTTANLNLRDAPATEGNRLAVIPKDTLVLVIDMPNTAWDRVKYGDTTGYAYSRYLANEPTHDGLAYREDPNNTVLGYISVNGGLVLRDGPSTASVAITIIPYNTEVVVLSIDKDWVNIIYDKYTGWARKDYIRIAPVVTKVSLLRPVAGPISQYFSENPANYSKFNLQGHEGVDFAVPIGTPVKSAAAGMIAAVYTDNKTAYGTYIVVQHTFGTTLYAHLSAVTCTVGQSVSMGTVIAKTGNTGNSTGPHLHFGFKPLPINTANGYNGYVDPMPLIT